MRALILAMLLALPTADTHDECFTDSCVGCLDDCLSPANELETAP